MRHEIRVPELEDFDYVEVIELLTKPGDAVNIDDSILTIESDKAAMEMPSPVNGKVVEILVRIGDQVSEGHLLAVIEEQEQAETKETLSPINETTTLASPAAQKTASIMPASVLPAKTAVTTSLPAAAIAGKPQTQKSKPHASPAVRQFARELGVELATVNGSGRKGRILTEDVKRFVKAGLSDRKVAKEKPEKKQIDFSRFGEVETIKLKRISRVTAKKMKQSWLTIPHVTQHDEADVETLETLRSALKPKAEQERLKLTILPFLIKTLAGTATIFPRFLSSINETDMTLTMKNYCHIGIAVDTPHGLMRPILKNVDKKSVFEIAATVAELSERAHNNSLRLTDIEGGCISITSLGNIGGAAFTPIVISPEVAVLGISRIYIKPVWDGERFVPRRTLPLDLSYDHRVINGADAARFLVHFCRLLADPEKLPL